MKQFRTHIKERILPESLDIDIENIILKMRETNNYRLFLATAICYYTGMRISECTSLHWKDVDFDNKQIFVNRRAWNLPGTKGSTKKNIKSRYVPLPLELAVILNDDNSNTWFFLNEKNDKHLRKETIERELQEWLKLHWTYKFKFHDLRHLYATLRVKENIPLLFLSKIMGHKNLETTAIYSHYDLTQYNFFSNTEDETEEPKTTRTTRKRTTRKKHIRKRSYR